MEARAAVDGIVEADAAAEQHDHLLDDAEPEAGAAFWPAIGCIGLGEFLEQVWLEGFRNAGAMIAHGDAHDLCVLGDSDDDLLTGGRELDRIGEEVGDDLDEPIGIRPHNGGS